MARLLRAGVFGIAALVIQSFTLASASPLFSQTPSIIYGLYSDFDGFPIYYDNFTLAERSTIENITWQGSYVAIPGAGTGFDYFVNVDNFTIAIFQDTGSPGLAALGSEVATFAIGNGASRSDTGTDVFGGDLFQYGVDLTQTLDEGVYWLAIVNSTVGDPDTWAWAGGDGPSDVLYSSAGTPLGTASGQIGASAYFILNGEVAATPLPAALPLFLTMLGGMAFLKWRKGKASTVA